MSAQHRKRPFALRGDWFVREIKSRLVLHSLELLLFSVSIFPLLTGCSSVKPAPFQAFSQSVQQLKLGTDKALETNQAMSSVRFLREAVRTTGTGDTKRVEQLRLRIDEKNPFSIDPKTIPLFMKAEQFRHAAGRAMGVFATYAELLVRLSSPELLPRETFDKMTSDLNANAYDAALSFGSSTPPDPQKVALFSTIAVALTREYLESKRRAKLVDALGSNQPNVNAFAQHMREGVKIAAIHAAQEYDEESQELFRNMVTRTGPASEPDRRNAIQALIELDRKYLDQVNVLQSLYDAFGQLPNAHAELINATANPDLNVSTIVALLEEGKRLEGLYDKSLVVNKAKATQAIADRAVAIADKLEAEAETAQLRADRALVEAEKAKSQVTTDPADAKKKTLVTELQERAQKLTEDAENKKKRASDARETALEAQKQADEVKKKLPG